MSTKGTWEELRDAKHQSTKQIRLRHMLSVHRRTAASLTQGPLLLLFHVYADP